MKYDGWNVIDEKHSLAFINWNMTSWSSAPWNIWSLSDCMSKLRLDPAPCPFQPCDLVLSLSFLILCASPVECQTDLHNTYVNACSTCLHCLAAKNDSEIQVVNIVPKLLPLKSSVTVILCASLALWIPIGGPHIVWSTVAHSWEDNCNTTVNTGCSQCFLPGDKVLPGHEMNHAPKWSSFLPGSCPTKTPLLLPWPEGAKEILRLAGEQLWVWPMSNQQRTTVRATSKRTEVRQARVMLLPPHLHFQDSTSQLIG